MKILKRTAQFDSLETASTPLTAQNIKLNIPKKTKLFVDQVRIALIVCMMMMKMMMMMMMMMMMTRRCGRERTAL